MFVSTMFVILCVSLYLRESGACIYVNAGKRKRGSSTRGIAECTNRPLRECVTLQPL